MREEMSDGREERRREEEQPSIHHGRGAGRKHQLEAIGEAALHRIGQSALDHPFTRVRCIRRPAVRIIWRDAARA